MKLLPKCLLRVFSFLLPFDDEEDYLTVQVILISKRNKNNRISNRSEKRAKTCRQWGIKKHESLERCHFFPDWIVLSVFHLITLVLLESLFETKR